MAHLLIPPGKIKAIEAIVKNLLSGKVVKSDNKDYLLEIANENGIIVKESNLHDVSAVLKKENIDSWEIIVNSDESFSRKLFSLAHELGHFFLHKEQEEYFIDGGIYRDENCKKQNIELEANEFAGQLLMPKTLIEERLKGNIKVKYIELQNLANEFNVSSIAMSARLKNLDYQLV